MTSGCAAGPALRWGLFSWSSSPASAAHNALPQPPRRIGAWARTVLPTRITRGHAHWALT
jgi:hypothetical protein